MLDAELLISHLSGPLDPVDRSAFRDAAETALAASDGWGDGLLYRTIVASGAAISIRRLMVVVPLGTSERISTAPSLPVRLRSNTVATCASASSN